MLRATAEPKDQLGKQRHLSMQPGRRSQTPAAVPWVETGMPGLLWPSRLGVVVSLNACSECMDPVLD